MRLSIQDKEFDIPQSWDDLPFERALKAYELLMHDTHGLLPDEQVLPFKRIELMKLILGIDDEFLRTWEADCIHFDSEHGRIAFIDELDFVSKSVTSALFSTEGKRTQISLTWTQCPWPVLTYKDAKGKSQNLYGPADALENLTIYELGTVFMIFERFVKTGDESIATELIATLYRPGKPYSVENQMSGYRGDRRLPLLHHESTVPHRMKTIEKLPHLVKAFVVFWTACCRHKIIGQYPNLFGASDSGDAERVGNDYAWGGVLLNLADGIVHLDQVASQPWATALTYMSMLEDRRKETELQMRKSQNRNR